MTFPHLFTPSDAMPASLRAHIRVPLDLFNTQIQIYATYHITDPGDFYAKEDAWSVANDPTASANNLGSQPPVPPYYVLMKLPDSSGLDVRARPQRPDRRSSKLWKNSG